MVAEYRCFTLFDCGFKFTRLSTHVKDFAQFAAALYQRILESLKVSVVLTETS